MIIKKLMNIFNVVFKKRSWKKKDLFYFSSLTIETSNSRNYEEATFNDDNTGNVINKLNYKWSKNT